MMKPRVCCVTGNAGKWRIFQETLGDTLDLEQVKIETPEIQSLNVEDIAVYSAQWAAKELGKPVLKTDVGYYITALNGFPGPFIKWMNHMLLPEQILAMTKNCINRDVIIRDAFAYAEPNGFTMVKTLTRNATLLTLPSSTGTVQASLFDQITLEEGNTQSFAEISFDTQIQNIILKYRHDIQAFGNEIAFRHQSSMANLS